MTLVVNGLTVSHDGSKALSGVSAEFGKGLNVIVGPNGAGKSSLLGAIAGLVTFDGTVTLAGVGLGSDPKSISTQVAVLSQRPAMPVGMTVGEYVLAGRAPYLGWFGSYSSEDEAFAKRVANELGLTHLAGRNLTELSGGQQQLVALARCFVQDTPVLLVDEPSSHLDIAVQQEVLNRLQAAGKEKTVLCVLHDLSLAARYAEELFVMRQGRLVAAGPVKQTLDAEMLSKVFGVDLTIGEVDGMPAVLGL